MYQRVIKRVLDFMIASIGLALLSPILFFLTIILSISNKGNPFFFQERPGKNMKVFKVIKFKTMSDKRDQEGNLLPDAERMTRIGGFVRKASLDEIPQLFNVLIGNMSLIGPRPLMVKYLPLYSDKQKRRHDVLPGITGWAQVNGRNNISWKKKFEYDVWYVENINFILDIKILLITIYKVFKSSGVSKEGHITTEAFNGNN